MRKPLLLIIGLLLLLAIEILRVYFIMPFPGSQRSDSIGLAWFLDKNVLLLRIIALLLVLPGFLHFIRRGKAWQKVLLTLFVLLYGTIFYFFNFRFLADKMFYPPKEKLFAGGADARGGSPDTTNKDRLVIGVTLKGEARAYPIEIIGYHHQVKDTLGGQPILVTYCTVCRTGRVFSPIVNGRNEQFRLVGMDHFNAMFEDATTKSWWQQATGVAIMGPLKGRRLEELPSAQMRLGEWQALYPNSLTLQPDPHFRSQYDSLRGYDEGVIASSLEKRDSGSWKFKSWVIGINMDGRSKAYDWNDLVNNRIIRDTIGSRPVLLTLASDDKTFHAFTHPDSLRFRYDTASRLYRDENTHSAWKPDGLCIDGPLKGRQLTALQSYQEFWHSWRTFHPGTERYVPASIAGS